MLDRKKISEYIKWFTGVNKAGLTRHQVDTSSLPACTDAVIGGLIQNFGVPYIKEFSELSDEDLNGIRFQKKDCPIHEGERIAFIRHAEYHLHLCSKCRYVNSVYIADDEYIDSLLAKLKKIRGLRP